ncbi:MAG: hypothetical protein K2X27_03595 [Candidatus Obscuribacterales bacterium]|nr:hypothetical protein [Candidatus Obscuribacterales bacterium]
MSRTVKPAAINLLRQKVKSTGVSLSILLCQIFPATAFSADDGTKASSGNSTLSFDVVFDQPVNAASSLNKNGFNAHLKAALCLDERVLAAAGSLVKGHVEALNPQGDSATLMSAKKVQFTPSTPFKIVFDEIITADNRSFKMHAVPANQCSMMTEDGRLRSIEIITGGIVSGSSPDSPLQLAKGSELLVRINRAKSSFKTDTLTKISPDGTADLKPALAAEKEESASMSKVIVQPVEIKAGAAKTAEVSKDDESKTAKVESEEKSANAAEKKADTTATDETKSAEDLQKKQEASLADLGVKADGSMSETFRVAFATAISSQTSQADDQVLAALVEDMKIGEKTIAKKGSALVGHIVSIRESSRWAHAVKANKGQKNAALRIQFDKLVTPEEVEYPILGVTPAQETTFKNDGVFKSLSVSSDGTIIKDAMLNLSGESQGGSILSAAVMALSGPQAAIAMPLILLGALSKAEPGIANLIHKKTIGKGDELQIFPGDQISVKARFVDPQKEHLYVAGKVVHGKKLKTIKAASTADNAEENEDEQSKP